MRLVDGILRRYFVEVVKIDSIEPTTSRLVVTKMLVCQQSRSSTEIPHKRYAAAYRTHRCRPKKVVVYISCPNTTHNKQIQKPVNELPWAAVTVVAQYVKTSCP